jgi:hypothetical protein
MEVADILPLLVHSKITDQPNAKHGVSVLLPWISINPTARMRAKAIGWLPLGQAQEAGPKENSAAYAATEQAAPTSLRVVFGGRGQQGLAVMCRHA